MKSYEVRLLGETFWDEAFGMDIYEAAENYVDSLDPEAQEKAWDQGLTVEVADEGTIKPLIVNASYSFSASDKTC